jgi:hypothetical protein
MKHNEMNFASPKLPKLPKPPNKKLAVMIVVISAIVNIHERKN